MEKNARFPFQFFIIAFIWPWILWIPLALASQGAITVSSDGKECYCRYSILIKH
jgi:hypothetical protein